MNAPKDRTMAELDIRSAQDQARKMAAYVQSFNDQKWGGVDESVDRQNLAVALDHLLETSAMLGNVAERLALTAPVATEQAQAVASGWKLVPVEPTEAMIRAGYDAENNDGKMHLRPAWRYMLAASPELAASPGAAPAAMEDGCALGCAESCMAKEHGCASECPALPWQPEATPAAPSAVTDERAAFEAWADDQGFVLQHVVRGDDYQDLRTQGPWDAWQARAALAQPAPVPVPVPVPVQQTEAVTDAMIDAYLKANDAYWKRTDELPKSGLKWRNGNPREATRESLLVALDQTAQAERIGRAEVIDGRVKSFAFEQTAIPTGSYSLYTHPAAPVQQDAPAPSMVGDAKGGA